MNKPCNKCFMKMLLDPHCKIEDLPCFKELQTIKKGK